MWKIINSLLHKKHTKTTSPNIFCDGNDIIHDSQEVAERFNNYFINIGPKLASQILQTWEDPLKYINKDILDSVFFKPITSYDLLQCINNLPCKKRL